MADSRVNVQVDNNQFIWEKDEGLFKFDGASSLLFWDEAIKVLLNTIEEVSGSDVSNTVLEATGFRMGKLVSSYYRGHLDIEKVLKDYSNIYRNAGWGNVNITYYSFDEKKAIVQSRNSWEHRILKASDKKKSSVLLPSHWAGVFSGIFDGNMWYKVIKSQLDGYDYDEIEIFPSDITPSKSIHELSRQKEYNYINELEAKVKQRTEELSLLVNELSSPVIPVFEDILVIPLIGKFNEERFHNLNEKALAEFSSKDAEYLLIDLTGINEFDDFTVYSIHQLINSVRLLGGECIIVGISPKLSTQMISANVDLSDVICFSTLRQGILYAFGMKGFDIVKKK
ncbi:STAS domain-containing protein [Oceanobacillus damuensis]|uniref:STAS domain-containing protein n=1 Tax=Oceanobacillus damuensis TaxID=937928 RepID=UPI00082F722D|nr:STAS domain-containing protein [Oceanobacillus damuensis]